MSVIINFMGANATTSSVRIALTNNSAHFALAASEGVQVNGTVAFNSLAVTQNLVQFGVSPGANFTGAVALNIAPNQPNGAPSILVSNLAVDSATVTYPTNVGPQTLLLIPGQAVTLRGFAPY